MSVAAWVARDRDVAIVLVRLLANYYALPPKARGLEP